jgi:hypothetical protein
VCCLLLSLALHTAGVKHHAAAPAGIDDGYRHDPALEYSRSSGGRPEQQQESSGGGGIFGAVRRAVGV